MLVKGEWEIERVPHSIYIRPLGIKDVWPHNPNIIGHFSFRSLFEKLPNDGEFNTFDDWRLVPTSRPLVTPPPFKENYLDLPATYGSLDYSRAHTGLPVYGNRTGSWEFVVLNDFRPWEIAYSDILHTIHGKKCMITLDDDLDYFYVGNLTLSEWRSDPGWSRIVINYNLEPYKYAKKLEKHLISLPENGVSSLELHPKKLGAKPDFPWIMISNGGNEDANVRINFYNAELSYAEYEFIIEERDKYIQVPEFILSNESGSNGCDIRFFTDNAANVYVQYCRGYM